METPFVFGKIASEKNFTDRKTEIEKLVSDFSSGVNTILISPRRWGKSSLVSKASQSAARKNKTLRFCFIDLNNVRTEEQFYQHFATKILQASASKTETLIRNTRKYLARFIPNITISAGPGTEFRLGLDWKEVTKEPDEILNLAEKIATANKLKFVVCLDEFQNISEFEHPLDLQKKMRANWQKHLNTSYCMYGSKRHMMMDVFTSPSMPFYKFGDIIFLNKISAEDWITFIQKRFAETGKKIGPEDAGLIAELTDCHPYYVQQLAQQSWLRTETACDRKIIHKAYQDLVLQLSMLFQNLTDSLSNTQINFLKALIDRVDHLSSQTTIYDYQLGTSANVVKIKNMLVSREIIDIQGNKITFLDPLYKSWLRKYFFTE